MEKKSRRLTAGQFKEVMEKGKISHSPLFLLRAMSGNRDERVAAVAPQKIFKSAVIRNKVRRRVYEAARETLSLIRPGVHMIVFAKSSVLTASSREMIADIRGLFVKAGILK